MGFGKGMGDPEFDSYGPHDAGKGRPPRARVRFDALGDAWRLFTLRPFTWIVAGLIVLAGNSLIYGAVYSLLGDPMPKGGGGFRAEMPPPSTLVNAILSAILNGFFLGGMYRMACLQVRGKAITVTDLFGVTDVARELVLGCALYGVICFVAGMFCVLPAFFAAGVLMFTLPLIVDGRLDALAAVRSSWNALKGQWFTATVFHLVAYLVTGLGACCCGIGLVLTMPLYCLSIAVLYRDFFLGKTTSAEGKPSTVDPDFA
jgi:hypothetical protein